MRKQLDESISDALKKLGQLKTGHLIYGKDWKPAEYTKLSFKKQKEFLKTPEGKKHWPKWMQRIDDWLLGRVERYQGETEGNLKNLEASRKEVAKQWEDAKGAFEDELSRADPAMKENIRKMYRDMEKAYEKTDTQADEIVKEGERQLEKARQLLKMKTK